MDLAIELLKTAFIGLVEGVTEWLPVSSTGHMILVDEFVNLDVTDEFWNMFLVVVQLGAILAVCVLYFTKLNPWARSKTPAERSDTWNTWGKILVGVVPAAAIGLPLNDFMEEHLSNAWVVAVALIVYGVVFIVVEERRKRKVAAASPAPAGRGAHFAAGAADAPAAQVDPGLQTMGELSYGRAFGIGCFQVLSLVPGTSRSGSTIIGGLLLGLSRTLAAEYSFFMAIPVMFGASALRLVKYFLAGGTFAGTEVAILACGMAVAFVTSVVSIKFLMRFIKTNDFEPFGVYRIVLGFVVIAYFLLAR
jgi:undecaprenyl-diphosphatase